MRAPACEVRKGSDARRSTAARVTMGMQESPISVILLQTSVRRLNERGLALLIKAAQVSRCAEGPSSWKEILPLWACASETIVGRAACCPMVLMDFNFQRAAWWGRVVSTQRCGHSQQPRISAFRIEEAIPLARDLLLEAWSAARSLPHVSSLVFGMAPEVTHADCTTLAARSGSSGRAGNPGDEASLGESAACSGRNYSMRRHKWTMRFSPMCTCTAFSFLGGELASAYGKPLASARAKKTTGDRSFR